MWSTIESGKTWRGEIRNKKKNGEFYWLESFIIPIFDAEDRPYKYVSYRFNITADKLIAEALEHEKIKSVHLGRLSAIGEMAAGIAHEINNPLTIIKGLLIIIERKLQGPNSAEEIPKILESVGKSQQQIIRMNKIINGLRNFSRSGDEQNFEQVSAQKIFDSVGDLCSEKLQRLGIRFEICTDEIEFQCIPIQIEQVLINLINNSADAISDLSERWIKVEVVCIANFVEISVTDSGLGISKEISHKIMQPFFTTKELGKGTGLGLSISRGIILKHGGKLYPDITAFNTRFVVQIPLNESSLLNLINLDKAISDHLDLQNKILKLINNPCADLDCAKLGSDNNCGIGKWIERIEPRFKNNSHFIELKTAHSEFHKWAGIVRQIIEGEQTISELTLDAGADYDRQSRRFLSALRAFFSSTNLAS